MDGQFFEDRGFKEIEELSAEGAPVEAFGSEQLANENGGAVAVDASSETVYVADGDTILTYPAFTTPTVAIAAPTDLQLEGSATLNGTVDPEGIAVEECKFEYVTDAAFKEPIPATNEVQTITLPSDRGFTLEFEGKHKLIFGEASPEEVQAALEGFTATVAGKVIALAGNVAVSPLLEEGGSSYISETGSSYQIEFTGELAETKLPQFVIPQAFQGSTAITTEGSHGGGWITAKTAACVPAPGAGTKPVPVEAEIDGLTPDTLYHYRLKTKNINGVRGVRTGEEGVFVAPARPAIAKEESPAVGSTEATLTAEVDPGGAPTTYYVEYGPSEAYGSTTQVQPAGAGLTATGVRVQLGGLQPGTEYHYRFVASNLIAAVPGSELTFTTPAATPPSTAALPDDRAYELVSPLVPGQEVYVPSTDGHETDGIPSFSQHGISTEHPFQAAADGEAVVYAGAPGPTEGNGQLGESQGSQFLATRSATGWHAVDIQPPGKNAKYQAFSSDLSVGILETEQSELGGGPAGALDVYAHATASGAGGEYDPLYTGAPPNRPNQFELFSVGFEGSLNIELYDAANAGTSSVPAFSDLLFEADDALLPGTSAQATELEADVKQEVAEGKQANELYDSAGGRLSLVNVLPDGALHPNASFGSLQTVAAGEDTSTWPDVTRAISPDGSRIFWTALSSSYKPEAIYVRENAGSPDASTVLVAEGGEPFYWMANAEGSLVLYTTNTGDLYSFNVETGQRTDLAPGGEVQDVLGSENGEYVYFIADGVLATNKVHNGTVQEEAVSGKPNIYLSYDGGKPTFIATGEGATGWAPGVSTIGARADALSAHVTPDGHSLVFESSQSLTGYHTEVTYTDKEGNVVTTSLGEVFLYEAGPARLHCVSCDPSGAPPAPTGFDHENGPVGGLDAAVSADGSRVFFDSGEPLLPTDRTGWLGVYEWEADGAGTCASAAQNGGCLYLLSGGSDPESSYLIGADESGDNVFFISRADLVAADRGEADVVYDARVDGLQPPATEACEGTACQGVPPAPPTFATPASVTFSRHRQLPPTCANHRKTKITDEGTKAGQRPRDM